MHLLRTTVCRRYRVFAGEGGKRAAIGECVAVECEEISHAAERPYVDLKDARVVEPNEQGAAAGFTLMSLCATGGVCECR